MSDLLGLIRHANMPKDKRPALGSDPWFCIGRRMGRLLGGIVRFAYERSGVRLQPLVAINVGASAPLIVDGLLAAVPAIRGGPVTPRLAHTLLLLSCTLFAAQRMDAQTATLHDEPLAPPTITYPAAARAAHIQGTVALEVHVSPEGRVTEVKALSGPPELRQAAIDAYSLASYRPVLRAGRPIPAVVSTKVDFTLNEAPPSPDDLAAAAFEPVHQQCETLARAKDPAAADTCRHALDLAGRFSPQGHMVAHALAYNDLALVLLAQGQIKEAAALGDEAVTRIADVYPGSLAAANAFLTRAETRSRLVTSYGDLKRAAADCTEAERILRGLIDQAAAPYLATDMKAQLKGVLRLHAVIARRNSQSKQAGKLDGEADRL